MSKPKYYYAPRFGHYNIYRDDGDGSSTKVDDRQTKEDALKEVYRLNGWDYERRAQKINKERKTSI